MGALNERLHQEALALGADFFGVADLSPAREYVERHGGAMVAQFPRAVSIGVAMPSAIVDQLPRHREDRAAAFAYRTHSYGVLNARLDQLASRLASALQREGCRAFPVRATGSPAPGATSGDLLPQAGGAPGGAGLDRQELPAGDAGGGPQGALGQHFDRCAARCRTTAGGALWRMHGMCGCLSASRLHREELLRQGAP